MEAQYGKFLDMIRAIRINVPLVDVLVGMPNYGKFLKELISNKHKLEQISSIFLSDESSAMIQNKVPPKLGDAISFLIPCTFSKAFSCNALADLGASINLIPYSLYTTLSLETLKPTKMSIRLADRSLPSLRRALKLSLSENKLYQVPTSINENGDEVVVFDEELMREGSEKWKNTVYGYFIGCNMPIYEVKYNLRRIWGKYGLKEIIVDEEGLCFIKFRSEEGENNMFNVPLEAWSTKGISTLSRRVLVELEAAKGLPESIEINYMDKQLKCKRTKWVKVETASEIKQAKVSDNNEKMRDGFQEVKNRRDKHVENRGIYAGSENGYQRAWNAPKDPMVDNRLVVDDYVKKKLQSTTTETKDWSEDMIKYFKYSWEAIERRENENIEEEDVCEYTDLAVVFGITDEVNGEGDSSGFHFTWNKYLKNPDNSILKKLDIMMVNDEFLKVYSRAHGVFLPFLVSDHSVVVMIFPDGLPKKEEDIRGYQMFKVVKKLKSLKRPVNQLNWKHGNLFEKANALRDKLKVDQKEAEKDPFNKEKRCAIINTLEEYSKILADELKHKSIVESICDKKGEKYWGEKVSNQIVKHFHDFLGVARPVTPLDQLGDIVQKKLSKEDTKDMIVEAWDIIGKEVCAAVREFFTNGRLLGEINSILIALVLKIKTPNKISDFRPIACCNVMYKCISKILTNRIKNGLSKVVSINQSAFIPGRYIQDNILLTQELLRGYNRKQGAKICAMKIDIRKSYDTLPSQYVLMSSEYDYCKIGDLYYERLDERFKNVDLCAELVKDMSVLVRQDNKEVNLTLWLAIQKAYDSRQNHDYGCQDDVENKLKTLIVKETPAVLVVAKEWQLS
ncbi:RNA-directed DNA polymerase, eukaryota, reverse transcriptase zinc-binding domain protein [Tanacetum coccineum]|uniref:RNA-directed DNA polymerase, eukaryota, reverse transcriptase zinc-binding domain protein n=1 Tax=Tanacetum coccineum TaxID=301880 RepID=A0ABQ4ZSU4_9ASTR